MRPPSTTAGSSSASPARASASRRSTTSSASSSRRPCSSPIRPGPLGDRRRHGRGDVRGLGRDDRRRHRVGHLRSGQHPPDGVPLRASGPRRACASRRARSIDSRGSGPTGRPGSSRNGPAARSRRASSTRTRRSRRRRASRSGRRASTGCSASTYRADGAARPAGAGRHRDRARRPPARASSSPAARSRSRWTPGRDRGPRGDRPDLAARPRIEADITEEVARVRGYELIPDILPDTPMPPYRPSPLRLRDAVRETLAGRGPDRGRDVRARVAGHGRAVPGRSTTPSSPGEGAAGGRPVTVTNPLSSQHSVLRQSAARAASSRWSRRTSARAATDVAIFEIGKGYGATDDGDGTHEWWRLGFALTGPAEIAGLEPAGAAVRPRRRQGPHRARRPLASACPSPAYAPLTDDPILHPGRAAQRVAADAICGPRRRAPSGRSSTSSSCAPSGSSWPSSPSPACPVASRRCRSGGRRRATRSSSATSPSSSPTTRPASEVEAAIRRHAGPAARRRSTLFDIYRGRPLGRRATSLAFRLVFAAADRTLTEAEVDRGRRGRHRRASPATSEAASAPDRPRTGPHRTAPDRPIARLRPVATRESRCYPCAAPDRTVRADRMSKEGRWTSGSSSAASDGRPAALPVLHGVLRARVRPGHHPPADRHRRRSCSRSCSPPTSPSRSATFLGRQLDAVLAAVQLHDRVRDGVRGRGRSRSRSSPRAGTSPSRCSRRRASRTRSSAACSGVIQAGDHPRRDPHHPGLVLPHPGHRRQDPQ